jgi:hypothetical protein
MNLHWPPSVEQQHVLGLLRRLASDHHRSPVVFEAEAVEGMVSHRMATGAHQVQAIVGVVESQLSGVSLSMDSEQPGDSSPTVTARLKLTRPSLSLITDQSGRASRAILAALAEAHFRGEKAKLQLILGPGTESRLARPRALDPTQAWWGVLAHGALPPSKEVAGSMDAKDNDSGFRALLRVGVTAASEGRRATIMRGLLAALRTVQAPGTRVELTRTRRQDFESLPKWSGIRLSTMEVASLIGWPIGSDQLPGMPDPHPRLLRLTATDIEKTRIFATTNAPGDAKPVGIGSADSLLHTHIVGPTNSGKSTLLLNLIVADLKAGRGMCVIDPKADLVREVLERIPAHRRNDVIILDPTQTTSVVGLNPLHVPGTSPELVADGILSTFRELFPSAFGPRVSDMAHASLLTLASTPGSALTWLPRLLTDARFRRSLLEANGLNRQEGLGDFWEVFDEMPERTQAQFVAPVLSRLRQFLLRPTLKRVLEQTEPRFTPDQIFTENKILLVPLNAGLLGKTASRLLGELLVSQLWQLSLARTAIPKAQRAPVSIFIDEVQEYLQLGGDDLNDALARSRSLGVAWHGAHQYRSQLSADMLHAFDSNARNKIVYAPDIKDAKYVAAMAPTLTPEDFMKLPQYAVYARLMRHGRQLDWISAQTLPPPPMASDPIEIIALSQANYGAAQPTTATVAEPEMTVAAASATPRTNTSALEATKPDVAAPVARIGRKKRGDL